MSSNAPPCQRLPDLDKQIAVARRRLVILEAERRREAMRGINRVLLSMSQGVTEADDDVGFKLLHRLDQLIPFAEREVALLEAERAAAMLGQLDDPACPAGAR